MIVMSFFRRIMRSALESQGYYLRHRAVLPYGVDYMRDIARLSAQPIRTFIDVGAHIGQTSIEALRIFPEARVIAFEPEPNSFSELRSRISSPRFQAYNCALDAEDRMAQLTLNGFRSSLILGDKDAPKMVVKCRTLDTFCREQAITQIDVLKIDSEGNEIPILNGARTALSFTTFVFCEFFSLTTSQGTSLFELNELLTRSGFQFVTSYTEIIEKRPTGFFRVMNGLFAKLQ
jgi:FkbM family methyltransferase